MPSQSDIVSQIRDTLTLTDPELDTSVGSVTRKIIDAVAEAISESYIDQQMLGYTYDIDSKFEADLDAFVNLFGISRLSARRSNGVIVFARTEDAVEQFVLIPVGTQIVAREDPEADPVILQTIAAGHLGIGDTSVSVPVQAVQAGPEANLPAGAVNNLISPLPGIATITNPEPITGGANMESDPSLRERWKKTVFRNMAGTEQMYLGIALDNENCHQANVVGAAQRNRELLQGVDGEATATMTDARHVYSGNFIVGRHIDAGDLFVQDLDYSFANTVPPVVTVLNGDAIPDGTLIEVDYEYVSTASRNIPSDRITNRIDVWCAGVNPVPAVQSIVFRPSPTFTSGVDDAYAASSFIKPDGSSPEVNNTFVPLAFGPLVTVPNTMSIGGDTYGLVTPTNPMGSEANGITYAYDIVHQQGPFGWAPNSLFGLEWDADNRPDTGVAFEMEYTYNDVPRNVQGAIETWRLVGTDALAHQAVQHNIRINLVVQYFNSLSRDDVDQSIQADLDSFFRRSRIGDVIQPSDILRTVANVSGVDAVRFPHGADQTGWVDGVSNPDEFNVGLQRIIQGEVIESYVDGTGRPIDIRLGDSDVAVFGDMNVLVRASNNFGAS